MRRSALFWVFVAGLCVACPPAGLAVCVFDLLQGDAP